ncbi:MAG TPA: YfbU family protein [Candidatus Nanopusillus sp.]|nr:YfbU family protein [Candidatus Nanopusillus sp.]
MLSKTERLILANQYRILKKLEDDVWYAKKYDEYIKILEEGYEIYYKEILDLISDENISESEAREVLDILYFYENIVEPYKQKNPNDQDIIDHHYSYFKGFDNNGDELKYLSFVRFLIKDQRKYAFVAKYADKTDDFDSHFPMLDKYRKMMKLLESKYNKRGDLEREEILDILNA